MADSPGFWTHRFKLTALPRRVFLVAVASLVPVAILSFALLFSNARDQQERLYRSAEDMVFAVINAVDAELKSSIAALDALAVSPRLARGDLEGLRKEALDLMERRPAWLNIVVANAHKQVMNARLAFDAPLPEVVVPEMVAETMRTQRPVIGNVMMTPQLDTYAFAVQIPYARGGKVRYVLTAVIRPESLLELLDLKNLAQQGVIAVLDRNDLVVARSLNHEQAVGRLASAGLVQLIHTAPERGRGLTHTIEGLPVYTVFRRSAYSGWAVGMGISQHSIDAPLKRSYLLFGGSLVLSILLGLCMALLVGQTIVRPIQELEASAASVGRGEAPAMPTTRLQEVRRVAVALEAAHGEREALFQREREARVAAEKASKAKDEFLAMLGHELRNPLAAITNATSLIERQRSNLEPHAAAATAIIGRQARHLARLTDDLLDAGRVILGKVSLMRVPVDLAAAVRATLDGLRSTGRLATHDVSADLLSAWVFADPTRVDQIVSNLLTNALKYTPAGGSISVTTRRDQNSAVLCVSDTGIGLEPELLPHVFELFVQGERALDRAQGGLGIGLTLVHRLTELHSGTVDAHSAGSGQGAVFTVRLPAIDAPSEAARPVAGLVTRVARDVALVEDNDDARLSLRMLLELDGHTVYEAADGRQGIDLIAQHATIEIAFIDIGLPGMDGFEVAREVRAMRGARLRLVAMSGYGAEKDITRGMEAGFDAYIVKPVDPAQLQREMDRGVG
jgi:signal transduction histidine kinase